MLILHHSDIVLDNTVTNMKLAVQKLFTNEDKMRFYHQPMLKRICHRSCEHT